MSAHRLRWVSFLACGVLLAGALGWVTWVAFGLEREQHAERIESLELEFQNRALGRLDAFMTTLLTRENQRPSLHYLSFFEPDKAFSLGGIAVEPRDYYQPSPLLSPDGEFTRLYFAVLPDGSYASPQLPQDAFRTLALDQGFTDRPALARVEKDLASLAARTTLEELIQAVELGSEGALITELPADASEAQEVRAVLLDPAARALQANAEQRYRNRLARWAAGHQVRWFVPKLIPGETPSTFDLLFLRGVRVGEERAVQGIWIAWPELEQFLLDNVRDIYATARLVPTRGAGAARLVTIPFTLEAEPRAPYELPLITPTRLALLGLWIALLAAGVAVAITMQKTVELSERRRSFVSAVTHELRTPLTTFCMYSEMLAEGIVRDPAAQMEYFTTLKDESVRLRRIVENVLEYARLEGRSARGRYEPVAVEDLLDQVMPALERRAEEAGMTLAIDLRTRPGCTVEVEVQAVEQILFNLVDNAAKYGTGGDDRVEFEAITTRDELLVTVADHGPGIPAEVRRAVFAPFKRAAGDAEGVIPGIGLGLSLSRGMARNLGGDVRTVDRDGYGAVFTLSLPLVLRGS